MTSVSLTTHQPGPTTASARRRSRAEEARIDRDRRINRTGLLVMMAALYSIHRQNCTAWQKEETENRSQLRAAEKQDKEDWEHFYEMRSWLCTHFFKSSFPYYDIPEFCLTELPINIETMSEKYQSDLIVAAKKANAARDHLVRTKSKHNATLTKQPGWCPKR